MPVRLVVIGALALVACGPEVAPPATEQGRPVRSEVVIDTALATPVEADGVLAARVESDLGFAVPGLIVRVAVRAGQEVERGEVLATLDPQQVAASVSEAEAGLAKAERDLARAERLVADSVVGRASAEDARTARDAAAARVESARFAARTATIVAPTTGRVLEILREPGAVVGAGTGVIRFAGTAGGTVFRVGVTDREVLALELGNVAAVTLDALDGRTFRGRVSEIAATPSPATATYAVEIALEDAAALPRGLAGRARITTAGSRQAQLVPVAALVEADGERGVVFTLAADTARRHEVSILALRGDRVALEAALPAGARVVTAGAAWLRDGEIVREVTP
ncbi:MAG TPA: efflux RND transporter periplasmic adaptor subunit [Gemmatimonadales bacterium]|nr:efflux RND transporter periplasmic adaptor subunit [Gemmatimonadales bacterium]